MHPIENKLLLIAVGHFSIEEIGKQKKVPRKKKSSNEYLIKIQSFIIQVFIIYIDR